MNRSSSCVEVASTCCAFLSHCLLLNHNEIRRKARREKSSMLHAKPMKAPKISSERPQPFSYENTMEFMIDVVRRTARFEKVGQWDHVHTPASIKTDKHLLSGPRDRNSATNTHVHQSIAHIICSFTGLFRGISRKPRLRRTRAAHGGPSLLPTAVDLRRLLSTVRELHIPGIFLRVHSGDVAIPLSRVSFRSLLRQRRKLPVCAKY